MAAPVLYSTEADRGGFAERLRGIGLARALALCLLRPFRIEWLQPEPLSVHFQPEAEEWRPEPLATKLPPLRLDLIDCDDANLEQGFLALSQAQIPAEMPIRIFANSLSPNQWRLLPRYFPGFAEPSEITSDEFLAASLRRLLRYAPPPALAQQWASLRTSLQDGAGAIGLQIGLDEASRIPLIVDHILARLGYQPKKIFLSAASDDALRQARAELTRRGVEEILSAEGDNRTILDFNALSCSAKIFFGADDVGRLAALFGDRPAECYRKLPTI